MKTIVSLMIALTTYSIINCQVPISQITGIVEIDTPQDSSSIYIGSKVLDSDFHSNARNRSNTVIGYQAGDSISLLNSSVLIGSQAAKDASQVELSSIIGQRALYNSGSSFSSTVLGHYAAQKSQLLNESIIIGSSAGRNTASMYRSVFIGNNSGSYSTGGTDNTGVGHKSLYRSSRQSNSALGYSAGESTNASNSIFIGRNTGESSDGLANIYLGSLSGVRSSGTSNINIGQYSAIGASGDFNIYLGERAGQEVTGNSNIILGRIHDVTPDTFSGRFLVTNTTGQPYIDGDRDGDTTTIFTNNFIIDSPIFDNSQDRLQVKGNSKTTGQHTVGSLKLMTVGSDDGFILTDNTEPSSDLFLKSNDKVIIDLDVNDDEMSSFSVRNSSGSTIFNLLENGNLSVDGTLVHTSDINRKYDINEIKVEDILFKIAQLNIKSWKYNGTEETHIGPMAQDFYAAFGLGGSDTTIATVDADGVALAAIKALAIENDKLRNILVSIQLELQQLKSTINEK